jgi:hypothetical protein
VSFRFCDVAAHPLPFFFVVRASPAVPALVPVKALNLRTSLVTGRRLERASRAAASVVAAGELSHATTAVARPQEQEQAAAAAAQASATRDPHQGRRWTRAESRSTRGREAVETPAGGDLAPRRGRSRGWLGQPPGPHPGCWWCGLTVA